MKTYQAHIGSEVSVCLCHIVEYYGYDYRREASPLLISALRDLDSVEADLRNGLKTELKKSSAPSITPPAGASDAPL